MLIWGQKLSTIFYAHSTYLKYRFLLKYIKDLHITKLSYIHFYHWQPHDNPVRCRGLFALLMFVLLFMCFLSMVINHKLTLVALKLLRFVLYRNWNNLSTTLIKILVCQRKLKLYSAMEEFQINTEQQNECFSNYQKVNTIILIVSSVA